MYDYIDGEEANQKAGEEKSNEAILGEGAADPEYVNMQQSTLSCVSAGNYYIMLANA